MRYQALETRIITDNEFHEVFKYKKMERYDFINKASYD